MEQSIWEGGKMKRKMDKVRNSGLMELHIKEAIRRVGNMDLEYLNEMMVVTMKESFLKMKFKDKENIIGNF